MQKRRICTAFLCAAGMFLLIMDGKTAILGVSEGIDICICSVIPSLFPFFVLGHLMIGTLLGSTIPILQPFAVLFRIPAGAESLLLTGFLGGYPVGAQSIAQAYRSGQLSKPAAERMLAFCNQPGPSFLFGILGSVLSVRKAWLLWGIQFLSAALVSFCIPTTRESAALRSKNSLRLSDAVHHGIRTMATVCGWVILFRMIIRFLDRWFLWILPISGKVGIAGILELANGCLLLDAITDESLKFLICSGILGFGGLCVTMQTVSVADGLSLRLYFPGKLLQACFAMLFSWLLFPTAIIIPVILLLFIIVSAFYLMKMEKRSRNRTLIGV